MFRNPAVDLTLAILALAIAVGTVVAINRTACLFQHDPVYCDQFAPVNQADALNQIAN